MFFKVFDPGGLRVPAAAATAAAARSVAAVVVAAVVVACFACINNSGSNNSSNGTAAATATAAAAGTVLLAKIEGIPGGCPQRWRQIYGDIRQLDIAFILMVTSPVLPPLASIR